MCTLPSPTMLFCGRGAGVRVLMICTIPFRKNVPRPKPSSPTLLPTQKARREKGENRFTQQRPFSKRVIRDKTLSTPQQFAQHLRPRLCEDYLLPPKGLNLADVKYLHELDPQTQRLFLLHLLQELDKEICR
jgi:hypothetical protein